MKSMVYPGSKSISTIVFTLIFIASNISMDKWTANHTSYMNFYFNEFVANALRDNIGSKKSKHNDTK